MSWLWWTLQISLDIELIYEAYSCDNWNYLLFLVLLHRAYKLLKVVVDVHTSYWSVRSYRWHLVLVQSLLLTFGAWCSWVSNEAIGTRAYRLMLYNFAICISCTWISFCAWINTFPIFTCSVVWTILIWSTSNNHFWRGFQICSWYKLFEELGWLF